MRPDAIDWAAKKNHLALPFLPRQRMHRAVWSWFVLVVIGQALAAAVVLVLLQWSWRQFERWDHGPALVQLAADQFSGFSRRDHQGEAERVLDAVAAKPGVAFALMADDQDQILAMSASAIGSWHEIRRELGPILPRSGSTAEPSWIDPLRNLLVFEAPLASGSSPPSRRLLLGIHDLGARRAMLDGAIAGAAGLALVALLPLPLMRRRLRRWTIGLRDLHEAIRRLAQGADPKPLPVGGDDEVAYLSIAFNDMASRLLAGRNALVEVNNDLERRVALRTEELHVAVQKLEELASSDMLTGLANRRALTLGMEVMFQASVRNNADLVCLAIDLDGFKAVNDTLGHAAGDELLKLAGDMFRSICRPYDLAARLGGDEFVLLLPMDSHHDAQPIAQRLLNEFCLRCATRYKSANLSITPSMSIGIASRKLTRARTAEQILHAADAALYNAKQAGKSRIAVLTQSDQDVVSRRAA